MHSRARFSTNSAVIVLLMATFSSFLVTEPGACRKQATGKYLFAQRCASCHSAGGNLVEPARPLKDSKNLSSLQLFEEYLKKPPGHMPYYEDVLKDPVMLKKLYDYCRTLKTLPIQQA